ncbi:MAG TPA: hydrogenase 2 operon protein HybA [Vicinamibacterales bacterium]|nr:hydrogenase 2 operon protein HybA [Vicinamibacterales bacterium]
MGITRRAAIRTMLAGGAAAAGAVVSPRPASAAVLPTPSPDALGLLYDATLCIGCKTCVVKCQEANHLGPDTSGIDGKYNAPVALNAQAKTVIKLYRGEDGESFMKAQCMHCVDPACVSACMIGALTKDRTTGIVSYNVDYCVGCRYCEIACPFNVPKFEWAKATPQIVKCELCRERLADGREPACTEICPRHAVIFGKRAELLREARRRIAAEPDKYQPTVYGETEAGGTQCLYLSHVPFDRLGLPTLDERPAPELARSIQHTVYRGFIAPVALYGALAVVMMRNRRGDEKPEA